PPARRPAARARPGTPVPMLTGAEGARRRRTRPSRASPARPGAPPRPGAAKKRVSAFAGSDLEMVLRARGITRLVLSGIATSGVVLSTLRQAADLDYRLTVLADGCADPDEEVHRVLTEKVFPRQAEVTTVEEWAAAVG
ncbi:isochorismatase family protein, partial [Streptomyces sp. NPDC020125]|uniref:cysteine hydrolase family protein n=1 Tax=Streptomyces sp. NPDC020125 TaxID=3154593 RepID=UPI0033D8424D